MEDTKEELIAYSNSESLRGGNVRAIWHFLVERLVKKFTYFVYLIPEITNGKKMNKNLLNLSFGQQMINKKYQNI